MRNKTLVFVLAILICMAFSVTAFAAEAKPVANTSAPAADPGDFDQDEVLSKFWKWPDSCVVGTVDGAVVTKGELLHALWYWNAAQLLNDLLSQKMIEQAAAKAGVTLTQAEQDEKEMEAVNRMGLSSVDELLKQYRVTRDRFIRGIRISALAEKTVAQSVKVNDAEYAEWIRARHILVRFPEDEADQAKKEEIAKQRIDEIQVKLKAGEDFGKLADEYSDDPGNMMDGKKQGGSLDWFTKGRMVQEFEKAAFELKVGEVSEPVKTVYGFHLIKVEAIGKDASAAEKSELKKMILDKKVPMEMQRWFSEMQAKADMWNKLQPPAPKEPTPVMRPQPAPNVAPRPNTNTPPPPPAP